METKFCPQCGAEYFAHVLQCAECHVALLTEAELEEVENRKRQFHDMADGEVVPIREGGGKTLKELRRVLEDRGITSYIHLPLGCSSGGCDTGAILFVAKRDAAAAEERLHAYYLETHPEAAHDISSEIDNCPACGYPAGADAPECPDCGLVLMTE